MLLLHTIAMGAALLTSALAQVCTKPVTRLLSQLTAMSFPPQSPTTTLNTSTCTPQSIAACPTPYDPCCAFVCAEAQVPFEVCAPTNRTVLASCYACPTPTP